METTQSIEQMLNGLSLEQLIELGESTRVNTAENRSVRRLLRENVRARQLRGEIEFMASLRIQNFITRGN